MGVGRAPVPKQGGTVIVDTDVVIPTTQLITIIDPETGELITVEQEVSFTQGKAVGLVQVDGVEQYVLVSSMLEGGADTFLGFQRNIIGGVNSARPLVTTARGAIITDPVVTGGVPLEIGKLVFLSAVSGEVTQDPQYYDIEGSVLLKLGYAISSRKMALVPDLTVRF